jgi:hypothetical protein
MNALLRTRSCFPDRSTVSVLSAFLNAGIWARQPPPLREDCVLEGMSFLECTKSNNNLANRAQPVLQTPHLLLGHVQSIVEHSEVLQHTVGDLDDEVRVAPAALQTSGEQEGTHTAMTARHNRTPDNSASLLCSLCALCVVSMYPTPYRYPERPEGGST